MKWKFSNGMIESVSHPGMVISNDAADTSMTLQSYSADGLSSQNWKRVNTRLLDLNTDQSWNQEWTVSFLTPGYDNRTLDELAGSSDDTLSTTCYQRNTGFSSSFDLFAKELVISDASDEEQCMNTREQLGFDKEHPFDTEVRDKFYDHMCDPFFTFVDHSVEPLAAPPQFELIEYTPEEYEKVEYEEEEYERIDYEEFTK